MKKTSQYKYELDEILMGKPTNTPIDVENIRKPGWCTQKNFEYGCKAAMRSLGEGHRLLTWDICVPCCFNKFKEE